MDVSKDILEIEARLKAARIPVAEFCRLVPVDPATWWRWRNGKIPRLDTWRGVERALADLEAGRRPVLHHAEPRFLA